MSTFKIIITGCYHTICLWPLYQLPQNFVAVNFCEKPQDFVRLYKAYKSHVQYSRYILTMCDLRCGHLSEHYAKLEWLTSLNEGKSIERSLLRGRLLDIVGALWLSQEATATPKCLYGGLTFSLPTPLPSHPPPCFVGLILMPT